MPLRNIITKSHYDTIYVIIYWNQSNSIKFYCPNECLVKSLWKPIDEVKKIKIKQQPSSECVVIYTGRKLYVT